MKKTYGKFSKGLSVFLAAGMITACAATGVSAASPTSFLDLIQKTTHTKITFPFNENEPIVLTLNKTYKLHEIPSFLFDNVTYGISTSNSKVISIAPNGTITANGTGTAVITVKTASGKTISKKITVKAPDVKINLNKTSLILGKGEKFNLQAVTSKLGEKVTWSSSNTKVVYVNSEGKITARANGTATITAKTPSGQTASCKVSVKKAPTKLSLNKTSITLGVGEKFNLDCNLPGNVASYNIKYSSDKNNIVSVDSKSGVIKANKTGTATITAKTYNGKTATCVVKVKQAPKSITINKKSATLKKGEKLALKVTFPDGSSAGKVTFYPSNSRIVSVSVNGVITAKNPGTVTVTAKTYNGKTVSCKVTVK